MRFIFPNQSKMTSFVLMFIKLIFNYDLKGTIMKFIIRTILLSQIFLFLLTFKLNAQDFKWVKGISSSVGQINSWSIAIDSNGNSYVTGFFFGTATFDTIHITSYGGADIFVAKYDPDGYCLWAKHAGNPSNNNLDDYGMGISVDARGNSYVTGNFFGTALFDTIQLTAYGPYENADIFLAKYDPNGNVIWAKQAGGIGGDIGLNLSVDGNGNSYVVGQFDKTATFGTLQLTTYGQFDIFIAKYDPDGNCLWANHAGGTSDDEVWGISIDSKGNSYVTGHFWLGDAIFDTIHLINNAFSSNGSEMFIAKYDANGHCLWAKEPLGNGGELSYGISLEVNGDCYVTGTFQQAIAFDTTNLVSYGDWDIFLAKYDNNGKVIWAKQAGGGRRDVAGNISIDAKGDCYVTGHFMDTASFGSFNLISRGDYDMFAAKYDHSGNCLWVQQAGGESTDDGHGIRVDANSNSYITGIYTGTAKFGTFQLSTNNYGAFIAKIPTSTSAIKNEINATPKEYSLQQNYPNPFNPSTTIKYQIPKAGFVTLNIYNLLGREVTILVNGYKIKGSYDVNFDASKLASGVYIYQLRVNNYIASKKMVLTK